MKKLALLLCTGLVCLVASLGMNMHSLAHAAPAVDASVSSGIGTSPSVPSLDGAAVVDGDFLQRLANAALSKDWILLTGFLLVLLQYALRADWSPVTKWVPWFVDTTIGGWVLNFLVSAAGALGLSAMSHKWSLAIVIQTLLLVATSTAVHHGLKDANGAKNGG